MTTDQQRTPSPFVSDSTLSVTLMAELFMNYPTAHTLVRDGKILFLNPAAVRLFGGLNAAEFIGRPIFDFIHPFPWTGSMFVTELAFWVRIEDRTNPRKRASSPSMVRYGSWRLRVR